MTATQLPTERVSSAVFRWWVDELTLDVPTLYPGQPAQTEAWPEWYELWVDQWSPRVQRKEAPELSDVAITLHAFVKRSTDPGRVQVLMSQAATIFNGRTLPITSGNSDEALLGYLKLGEARTQELTRLDADSARQGLLHHVAQWRGLAQRVP